jgi:uncharacterized SAM-binding protein YcdF (DUF218 family)
VLRRALLVFTLLRLLPLIVLAWIGFAVWAFVLPSQDNPARASAIMVLSGDASRVQPGVELARRGVAPILVLSDGRRSKSQLARELCAHPGGHSFRILCFRPKPLSTRGEAREAKLLAAQRGWRSLLVVTSTYHVYRARLLFERCLPPRVRLSVKGTGNRLVGLPLNALKETGKLLLAETLRRSC